nr:intracellular protein transport protein USO1 isoform X3 [Crassostrea gigas]
MPVTGRERGGTQPAGAQKSKLPTKTPSNTKPAKNASAQGAVAKNPSPSPVQRSRPLPPTPLEEETTPLKEEKRKVLKGLNKSIASNNVSDQKLKATEKQHEDISKELQTLAQELNVTDGSPQKIIEAACREIRNSKETTTKDQLRGKADELEELKKVIFSVNTVIVKEHEHDKEKAIARIQDLYRCQEDLTVIKTAVMNPTKSKDFKPTQTKEEVVERINALHGEIQNLKETTTKDKKIGRAKELESNLEELKKVVFLVTKVKEKEHNIEKTKAKIQDLHRCQEDLTLVKTAVMNPTKSKDFKLTQSTEEVVERINALHGIEHDCLELKAVIFNKELRKFALFGELEENQCTVEKANKIVEELTSMYKKMEADQKMLCTVILGKNKEPDMEEALNTVQFLKKAADESNNDIQQKKAELEQMEKDIDLLMKQLKETENKHQTMFKTYQEREQKLRNDLKEVKSQKEIALTRLSEVAGAKLTESNPLITDLSDPNRPEKIGEQFSELYDNLWTDIFEKLSGTCKLSERDSIQTLLQILEDSYGYCKDISSKRYSNTLAELTLWKLVDPKETPSKVPNKKEKNTPEKKKDADTKETTANITLEELQKLQTLLVSPSSSSPADSKAVDSILAKIGLNVTSLSNIKKMLKSSLEGTSVIIQESFWKQRSEDPNGQKEVLECTKPFLLKCVHICWLMVGQDPPVFLRFSDKCKDKFNKDIYREYTASGKMLDFVVWPAIFLHENGPLLKKGVAQPISKK